MLCVVLGDLRGRTICHTLEHRKGTHQAYDSVDDACKETNQHTIGDTQLGVANLKCSARVYVYEALAGRFSKTDVEYAATSRSDASQIKPYEERYFGKEITKEHAARPHKAPSGCHDNSPFHIHRIDELVGLWSPCSHGQCECI